MSLITLLTIANVFASSHSHPLAYGKIPALPSQNRVRVGPMIQGCVTGGVFGGLLGGPVGSVVGCGRGAAGITTFNLLTSPGTAHAPTAPQFSVIRRYQ